MSYRGKSKGSYGIQNIRRARRVQARRSDHAKAIDRSLKAKKAESVEQWIDAPNRFDLPNVDTNKPQENEITISQFKVELTKAIKESPEWKTASKEMREAILYGIEHKPNKIQEMHQSYIKSGKTMIEWLKNTFDV